MSARLPTPTADPVELTRAAHALLPQLSDGVRYARAGLMLTDLRRAEEHITLDMFRHAHEESHIADLMSRVQKKTGRDALGLGYAGLRPGPKWQMKREMLTGRATTHWDELATGARSVSVDDSLPTIANRPLADVRSVGLVQ